MITAHYDMKKLALVENKFHQWGKVKVKDMGPRCWFLLLSLLTDIKRKHVGYFLGYLTE